MGKYELEIELTVAATDSNKILGRCWATKHRIFEKVKQEVCLRSKGKTPETPLSRFRLSFTRYSPRTLDFDNFVASLKPTIDGLRIAGIIEDDTWALVNPFNTTFDQVISKDKKLRVRIEED